MHSETIGQAWLPAAKRAEGKRLWRSAILALVSLGLLATGLVVARGRARPPHYLTAQVELRSITRQIAMSGHVDVQERTAVPATVSGRLLEVRVAQGDRVTEGQLLALLDSRASNIASRSASAAHGAARGKVAEARALLQSADEALALTQKLRERQLASESELESARSRQAAAVAALTTARAQAEAAEQMLRGAQLVEEASRVVAPRAGVVLRAPDSRGAAVSPDGPALFEIGSPLEQMRIDADVAEADVGQLRVGQAAHFVVPAYPERVFQAAVVRVGVNGRRSAVAVYYPVELRTDNRDGSLLPGMTATVTVDVERVEDVLASKEAALRFRPADTNEDARRSRVWQVTETGLRPIAVTAGISDGTFTELRPRASATLRPGTKLAIGVVASDNDAAPTAGIRLGNR